MLAVRTGAVVVGAAAVLLTLVSAIRTLVVPRAIPVALSRMVMRAVRWCLLRTIPGGSQAPYGRVDRRLAFHAPVGLLVLVATWLSVAMVAYAVVYWGLGEHPWDALEVSGSSLLTLGSARPRSRVAAVVTFTEAAVGIGLLALLITYLPTIYAAFQRREALVALLEVRAGSPPSAVTMLERYHLIGLSERADELWQTAEAWFADVEESHTSIGSLPFLRSPQPDLHWVTTAGALLDAASLTMAALDGPRQPNAALCVRSGYVALRRIADFFGIEHDADPDPGDPISISRESFDAALDRLAAVGAPVTADRDRAWSDFAGWRVNYDRVLGELARLTFAAPAPWLPT